MKNLITYPRHRNAPSRRSHQSRFNHLIDLAPMQALIAMLAAQFARVLRADDDYALLWRLSREKGEETRRLEKAKWHNFKVTLKAAMLGRRRWREKVLADLGGEDVLQKWEAQAEAAAAKAARLSPADYVPPVYKRPKLASLRMGVLELPPLRTPFDIKTDATGCFRLAPLPAPRLKRPDDFEAEPLTWQQTEDRQEARRLMGYLRDKQRREQTFDESRMKGYWYKDEDSHTYCIMAPIPLLPDELRGVGIEDDEGVDEDDPADFAEIVRNLKGPDKAHLGLPDYSEDHSGDGSKDDKDHANPPP